jgi:hypothetical protein
VLPASEDDVIHMLRWVSSAISAILLELRRGNLHLRCGQFVVDYLSNKHVGDDS